MPFEPGLIPEGAKPFEPGQSGNPEGRPKGSRNLSTILKEFLEEEIEENGAKVVLKDSIVRKLIKKANAGNLRAIQEIFDRTEGKAKQDIKLDIPHLPKIEYEDPPDNDG